MSFYALDDWKVSPKLTLNIGMRYEYAQIPKELSGLTPSFDPKLANGQGGLLFPSQNRDAARSIRTFVRIWALDYWIARRCSRRTD